MTVINRVLVGESLVGEGAEVAHIDLIMGPRGSPAEDAFTRGLANNKDGFTTLLAILAPNLQCKPNAIIFNKVTIRNARQAVQMFGPAQYGVARAIQDCVAEGIIPRAEADDVYICVGVFVHWECNNAARIQDFNYRATREAIVRAIAGWPSVREVSEKSGTAVHPLAAKAAAAYRPPPPKISEMAHTALAEAESRSFAGSAPPEGLKARLERIPSASGPRTPQWQPEYEARTAPPSPAPAGGRRQAGPVEVDAVTGTLVHKIPNIMRIARPETIEVRVGGKDVAELALALQGSGDLVTHDLPIVETMTVTLDGPLDAFDIIARSEATQLVRPNKIVMQALGSRPYAAWEWSVTPLRPGRHELRLKVAATVRDSRDIHATVALRDKHFPVIVSVDYGRTAGSLVMRALAWLIVTIGAALLGIYTQEIWWPVVKGFLGYS